MKLSDFGLSKVVTPANLGSSSVVTPYFMAPELYRPQAANSEFSRMSSPFATDVPESHSSCAGCVASSAWPVYTFSFGMMLFVLVYGCDVYAKIGQHYVKCKAQGLVIETPSSQPYEIGKVRWGLVDCEGSERPHPVSRPEEWETALGQVNTEPQCPKSAVHLIRRCTSLDPTQRPSVSDLRNATIFRSENGSRAIDWPSLVA